MKLRLISRETRIHPRRIIEIFNINICTTQVGEGGDTATAGTGAAAAAFLFLERRDPAGESRFPP